MTIAIGCDFAGYELLLAIEKHINCKGIGCISFGANATGEFLPFYVAADSVCDQVLNGKAEFGILICGTGMGMSYMSNRKKGIRAALCESVYASKLARVINDGNVLCMGAWFTAPKMACEMTDVFIDTEWREGLDSELSEKIYHSLNAFNNLIDGQ